MGVVATVNTWLGENQAFVTFLATPIISALAAVASVRWSSRQSIKASKSDRFTQKYLKLSDYQNDRINKLAENFANLSSTIGFHQQFGDKASSRQISYYCDSLLLSVNHDDPIYEELRDMIISALKHAIDKNSVNLPNITDLGRRIILSEQNALKKDLLSAGEEGFHP